MKIIIEVEKVERGSLFFTEELGDGNYKGEPFTAATTLQAKSLIVSYKDERYMVDTKSLVGTILEAVEKGE
jgi:hypothetical protein